jgi:hypothetical protein
MIAVVGVGGIFIELALGHEFSAGFKELLGVFDAEKMQLGPSIAIVEKLQGLLPPALER